MTMVKVSNINMRNSEKVLGPICFPKSDQISEFSGEGLLGWAKNFSASSYEPRHLYLHFK